MKNIKNLNKESIICIIVFLLIVMFFLQPCVFSKLFQTILGRIFLVTLIIYVTYCNQIWGLLFVLFLIIISNHDSMLVEGFDVGDVNKSISILTKRANESNTPEGKAGSLAILSVDTSTDPHKIFLKKVARIVQNYSYDNNNPKLFSVKPLQKTLLDKLNILKTARFANPTAAAEAVSSAQLNYLENLSIIGEEIISQYPLSGSAKKIKKAKQVEIESSIKAEPRPMAPSVLTPPVTQESTINTDSGSSAGNVVAISSLQQDEINQNKAVAEAIAMGKNSTIPQTNYQSKAAEIAQKYSDDHPGNLYGVIPAKIQLLKAVTAANTPGNVNTQGQLKMAQMIYLETLERIARNIASNLGPSSPEAVALKKAQDERDAKIAGSTIISKPTVIMGMPSPVINNSGVPQSLEGFDLLGLEDGMKRGKQSNSIQVGNSYNNSVDIMPYEKSFFSPFHF